MLKLITFSLVLLLSSFSIVESRPVDFYDPRGQRDPLWPLVSSSGVIISYNADISTSDMILEGIIADDSGKNIAIINGNIVGISDTIGAYTVKAIDPSRVLLQRGQEEFSLNIKKEQ